jgi:hypothetical protein
MILIMAFHGLFLLFIKSYMQKYGSTPFKNFYVKYFSQSDITVEWIYVFEEFWKKRNQKF